MELVSKISKGSKMDQIYIPKKRNGLVTGSYVVISALKIRGKVEKPYFYNVKDIEPLKLEMINEMREVIENNIENYDNVLFVGSFLDKRFNFNDIDIILISDDKVNIKELQRNIWRIAKIKIHIIVLSSKELIKGLSTDPWYLMMLSKYISKKRFIYNVKREINYKILDLHLLKSKGLSDNFDILKGNEKYYLVRNMVAILLFLEGKKIGVNIVDKKIEKFFKVKIENIKENMLEKKRFLNKYKEVYTRVFNEIMKGIKNGSKQK